MTGKSPDKMFKKLSAFDKKVNSETMSDVKKRLQTQNYLRKEPLTYQKAQTATIFKQFLEAFSDPKSGVFWCKAVTVHR